MNWHRGKNEFCPEIAVFSSGCLVLFSFKSLLFINLVELGAEALSRAQSVSFPSLQLTGCGLLGVSIAAMS